MPSQQPLLPMRTPLPIFDSASLDATVERFEAAWNTCTPPAFPTVCDYLPVATDGSFSSELHKDCLLELLRVDLERRMTSGFPKTLIEYQDEFPFLSQNPDALAALAFEEYRLFHELRVADSPAVYAAKYGVDISEWPGSADHDTRAVLAWNESTLKVLADESDRLVAAIVDFPDLGERVGEFTIRELLGEGKFARVYLAHQSELADRPVVLKISPEVLGESDKLARLQHTHIVPIYSMHRLGALNAICMPYFGRETLENRLRSQRRKVLDGGKSETTADRICGFDNEADCANFVAKVADALHHAHERGIVHRDLKPANLLIGDDGEPFVLDFNLAESLIVGGPVLLMVGGTLPYMAPEHLEAVVTGARLDRRCDVYSLGVILYRMVTDEIPFPNREGSFVETLARLIQDRRSMQTWRATLARNCSSDMASIIEKCLEPSLVRRYATAAQLSEDLRRHGAELSLKFAANRSPVQRCQKWWCRNRHWASPSTVAVSAAVLMTVALGIALVQNHRNQTLEAQSIAEHFQHDFPELRLPIVLGEHTPSIQQTAIERIQEALRPFHVLSRSDWREMAPMRLLSMEVQQDVQPLIGELLFLMAHASGASDSNNHAPDTGMEAQQAALIPLSFHLLLAEASRCLGLPETFLADRQAPVGMAASTDPLESVVPTSLEGRLRAMQRIEQQDYQGARSGIEAAVRTDPRDAALWLLLGYCQADAEDLSLAELSLTRSIALAPDSPLGYFHRGICRLRQQRPREAEEDFSVVLQLRPQTPEAHFNRALARRAYQDFEQALQDCNEALRLGWDGTRTYLLRAELLDVLGENESAITARHRGLLQSPRDALDWIARGMEQVDTDPDAAIDDLKQGLKLDPNSREALQNLAHLYAEILGQPGQALEFVDQLIERYPNYGTAAASKAVLHARLGADEEAQQWIDRALHLNLSAETYYLVASAYAQMSLRDAQYGDRAADCLRRCLVQDWSWFHQAIHDEDFLSVREHPKLNKLMAATNVLLTEGEADAADDTAR